MSFQSTQTPKSYKYQSNMSLNLKDTLVQKRNTPIRNSHSKKSQPRRTAKKVEGKKSIFHSFDKKRPQTTNEREPPQTTNKREPERFLPWNGR